MFSLLITASKRQRASASYDDAPSCQVHRAQSHATAGEQQPCHTSFSRPSPIPLFVLIGTHVFINPFLHLLIYLLNKNSCSLEGGSKYCLEHICWHLRFNLVSVMNCGAHSVTAAAPENQSRWGKWKKRHNNKRHFYFRNQWRVTFKSKRSFEVLHVKQKQLFWKIYKYSKAFNIIKNDGIILHDRKM